MESLGVSWTLHAGAMPPDGATPVNSAPPAGTAVEHLAPDRGRGGPGPVRGGSPVGLGRHEAVQRTRAERARGVGGDQPAVLATRLGAESRPEQLFSDLPGLPAASFLVLLLKCVGPAGVPPALDPVQELVGGTPAQLAPDQRHEFARIAAAELPYERRRQRMQEIADRVASRPLPPRTLTVAVGRRRRVTAAAQTAAVAAEPVVEPVHVRCGRPAAFPAAGGAESAEAFASGDGRPGPLLAPAAATAPAVLVMDGSRIASEQRE